jgi:hypothetical protein
MVGIVPVTGGHSAAKGGQGGRMSMRSGGGSAGWRRTVALLTWVLASWVPLSGGATGTAGAAGAAGAGKGSGPGSAAGAGTGVTVNDVAFCTEVYAVGVRKAGEMGNPDVQQVYRHAAGALAGIGNREVGPEFFGQRRAAERPKAAALTPAQLGKAITQCNAVTAKLAPK